jgi:hypothetical protein
MEQWDSIITLKGRICEVAEHGVVCDVLVDDTKPNQFSSYQERLFAPILFAALPKLSNGIHVLIIIKTKPGSTLISVEDGEGKVDPALFKSDFDFSHSSLFKKPNE